MNIPQIIKDAAEKYAKENYQYNTDYRFLMAKDSYEAGAMESKEYWQGEMLVQGDKEYKVKFYDNDRIIDVKAPNFTVAGFLATAFWILNGGSGYDIVEYIESVKTGNKVPFELKP